MKDEIIKTLGTELGKIETGDFILIMLLLMFIRWILS